MGTEREELIKICEDAVVSHKKWIERDSCSAQNSVKSIYLGLTAGLDYRIVTKEMSSFHSDELALVIEFLQPINMEMLKTGKVLQISTREQYFKDCDPEYETEMFTKVGIDFSSTFTTSYMPTRERLEFIGIGNDWVL